MATTITKLADFIDRTNFEDIPERVIHETKRLLLDSIGCALAGVTADKGKWGVEYPVLRGPVPGSRLCCFNGLRSRCYRSASD